jgi:hypothetical protein
LHFFHGSLHALPKRFAGEVELHHSWIRKAVIKRSFRPVAKYRLKSNYPSSTL